jgi:hypothetical protein
MYEAADESTKANEEEEENGNRRKAKITTEATYQDVRDDRVYTFYDLKNGESKTFTLLLNASYLGKYYLPTVYSEAMYDRSINARQHGKWVEVVKEGK